MISAWIRFVSCGAVRVHVHASRLIMELINHVHVEQLVLHVCLRLEAANAREAPPNKLLLVTSAGATYQIN